MTLPESDLSTGLAERILRGDVRAAARLMRDIDDQVPSAATELRKLFPHTGNAHIVGFTGSPGVGKSTLVDQMARILWSLCSRAYS